MKKVLRILLWTVLSIVVIMAVLLAGFIYKIRYGFPVSFETEIPAIEFPAQGRKVLLFSKTTGFRHGESIEAGKEQFAAMAEKNDWFLFSTEEGGVFNNQQLSQFDVVVFNNSTGRVLNDEQQKVLEDYVTQGGTLVGIHGAGDNSHHWPWYVDNLVGFEFSHHTLNPQFQETTVWLNAEADSALTNNLPPSWTHSDEWYVFFDNPAKKDFTILDRIDGSKIDPNGNILWTRDKDFGMGKDHPVAWYKHVGEGKTFYTSMGHSADSWKEEGFLRLIENAVNWK